MDIIECSCLGSNERCMHCDGTGLRPARSILPRVPRSNAQVQAVEEVGSMGADHLSHEPSPQKFASVRPISSRGSSPKLPPLLFKCPKCPNSVENLEKHYLKCHLGERLPQVMPTPLALIQSGKCPFCTLPPVDKVRLLQHLKKHHGLAFLPGKEIAEPTGSTPLVNPEKSPATPTEMPQDSRGALTESALDATRRWGAFRDNGQFGSHPAHDDMDDESSP